MSERLRLPIIGKDESGHDIASCLNCATACCFKYFVPLNNYDLWRMCKTLGLAWHHVVYAAEDAQLYAYSFRLDAGERRYSLRLFRRVDGACHFLMRLPDQLQRCGIHAARPHACRQYPFKSAHASPDHVEFISHALCPTDQKAGFEARRASMAPEVTDEAHELQLSIRAMERWDAMAKGAPTHQPRLVREYAEWMLALYESIDPLRQGERFDWHNRVMDAIDAFPLPELFSSAS